MKIRMIETDKAPAAVGPYSQAVKAGDLVFVSGQIPLAPGSAERVSEDVTDQTRQCLENLSAVLKAAGSSLEKVLKVTLYIQDMGDFQKINEIYARFFPHHRPARACVEVARLPKEAKVEIEAVAAV